MFVHPQQGLIKLNSHEFHHSFDSGWYQMSSIKRCLYLKLQMFLDSERWDKQIVLLYESGDSREDVRVDFRSIEVPLAVDFQFPSVSKCQAIEKCCLSSSTCSHDGEKFSRLDTSRYYIIDAVIMFIWLCEIV
jgi:hypothetical protein